jgi:hypothetical protein
MKKWAPLACFIQAALGLYQLSQASYIQNDEVKSIGFVMLVTSLMLMGATWSRGDSLLALWVQRKRLEQKKKIAELETE